MRKGKSRHWYKEYGQKVKNPYCISAALTDLEVVVHFSGAQFLASDFNLKRLKPRQSS